MTTDAAPPVEVPTLPVGPVRVATLSILLGSLGAAAGGATPQWIRPAQLVVVAVFGVIVSVVAAAIDITGRRSGLASLRQGLVELTVLILGARVVVALTDGLPILERVREWPAGFFDGPMLAALAVVVGSWIATGVTIADLERLGRPLAGARDEVPPLTALTVRYLTGATLMLVLGSVALSPWSELITIARAPVTGVIWPLLVYLPVGLLALGVCRVRDAQLRWVRLRAVVHGEVRERWMGRVVIVALALALTLAVLPTGDTSPIVRATGAGLGAVSEVAEGIIDWIQNRRPQGGDVDDPAARTAPEPTIPFQDREVHDPIEPGEPVISPELRRSIEQVVLWAVVAAVAILTGRELWRSRDAFRLAYRRERARGGRWRGLLAVLVVLPGLVWAVIRAWLRRSPPVESAGVEGSGPILGVSGEGVGGMGLVPDGVRDRISSTYRTFRDVGATAVGPPGRGETPDEFGRRVSDAIPQVEPSERSLTALFEEARFSDHHLESAAAEDADDLLDDIEARLGTFENGAG